MRIETLLYAVGFFCLSFLIVTSTFEYASGIHPVLQLPVLALGLLSGFVVPAFSYLTIDELSRKYDKWRKK